MGGKPTPGTKKDMRLKPNKSKPAAKSTAKKATTSSSSAKPKFGSPAWNAKYGIKKK